MADKIKLSGIFTNGYGVISRLVMQDSAVDIGAKGLYAYLCSYSGSGNTCYPSRNKICHDLNIGKETVSRYINQLTGAGYIQVERVRDGGKFLHNLYTIVTEPRSPCTDLSDTVQPDAVQPDTENADSINIRLIKNTEINNIESIPAPEKHRYGEYKNVLLSDEELDKLRAEFPSDWNDRIERLSEYIASKGAKYTNHLATIRNWARRDAKEHQRKNENDGWAYITAVGKGEIV